MNNIQRCEHDRKQYFNLLLGKVKQLEREVWNLFSLHPLLYDKVESLGLPVKTIKVLHENGIYFVGDLVQMNEWEVRRLPKIGRTSMNLIREILAFHGISFYGHKITGWTRP